MAMKSMPLSLLAASFMLILVGCPERSAVWIEAGSSADSLVFGVGRTAHGPPPANLHGLTISPCGADGTSETAVWAIARTSAAPVPARINYGLAPHGYSTVAGPTPLRPGCYVAADAGSGRLRFEVKVDGTVEEARP